MHYHLTGYHLLINSFYTLIKYILIQITKAMQKNELIKQKMIKI
jgi:hypothetical protein